MSMSSVHLECSECHEKAESEDELRNHVSINHLRYVPYQCFHCLTSDPSVSTYFATECAITEHISKVHGQNLELKFICHLVQSSKNELETIIKKCFDSLIHVESGRPESPVSLSFSLDTPAVGPSTDSGQENSTIWENNSLSVGHNSAFAANRCNVCKSQLGHDSPEFEDFITKREHVKGHFRLQFNLGDDYDFEFLDNKGKEQLLQLFNLCFPEPENPELAAYNNPIENLHLLNQSPLLDQENPPLPHSTIPPQELHSIDESSNLQIEHLLAGLGTDGRRSKKRKRKSFLGSSKSKKRRNSTRLAVSTENVLINSLQTPQNLERSELRTANLKAAERVLSNSRKIRSAPKNFKLFFTPNINSSNKNDQRWYCFKCKKRTNAKHEHLQRYHLKQDIYFCKYCDFAVQCCSGNLRKHIRRQHKGKPIEYINKLKQYKSEIDKLTEECFGDGNSQIAEEEKFENNGSLDFDDDEHEVRDEELKQLSSFKSINVAIVKPSKKKKILNTKPAAIAPPTEKRKENNYCVKCQKWTSDNQIRHILAHHLNQAVFCCKYCDFATQYSGNVRKHIRNQHKGKPIEYIDKREQYQSEIDKLMEECFGNGNSQIAEEEKFENNGSLDFDNDEQEVTDDGQRNEELKQLSSFKSGKVAIGKPTKKKKLLNTKLAPVTPPTGTKNKRYYCTKCQKLASDNPSRHILVAHLNKDAFCCKYCDIVSKRCGDLMTHIRRVHKEMPIEYIDKRNEYQDEINLLREECFGLSKTQFSMSNDSAVDQSLNDETPGPAEIDDGKGACIWCDVKCSPRSLRSHQRGCQKKQQSVNGDASCSSAGNDSNSIMSGNEAAETGNMDEIMAFIKQELD